MMETRNLTMIILMLVCSSSHATIINIPADFPTIQQGIDASVDGDTVLVQPGTYVENINFNGHNIVLGSLFLTTGDTTYIAETVIDGDSAGSVVGFEHSENESSILKGFTIQNGYRRYYGGGIYCINSSSPVIERNVIKDNVAWYHPFEEYGDGGGIACKSNSSPKICGNMIIDNHALFRGGGVYCDSSSPIIINNIIMNNSTPWGPGGAGIASVNANPVIIGNIIARNSDYSYAGSGGGILCTHWSNPIIINNLIFENHSYWPGGGMDVYGGAEVFDMANCILWGNNSDHGNTQIRGPVYVAYSDIQGSWEGEGNIDTDPLFRDPDNGDFHLMSTACGDPYDSPCIDTGSPAIIDSLLDCSWGLGTILSDMGAYGGGDSAMVAVDDYLSDLPDRFAIFQNFPNPFNPSTTIRYSLPEQSDVRIEIYNILGQRVEQLFDGFQPAGNHSITWDATKFPSGVYFARIGNGDSAKNIKMVLLR